ncbi:hypothetical protein MRS44_016401 [Fusarium solani]|uniref:uncharacterized protein n=1 Tax=Fusarium solani TaxID=169388 RepID=UPI0032C49203|nr:hypothetical protein MRS44_016401 [Fusarium solani]
MPSPRAPRSPLETWATNATQGQLNAFSGAVGGFASGIFTCPLDVIKIRLQAQGSLVPVRFCTNIPKSHYPKLIVSYKYLAADKSGPPEPQIQVLMFKPAYLSSRPNSVNILSSIAAGTASTIVTNPIWTVKVRLMSQAYRPCRSRLFRKKRIYRPHWHYHSTLDAAYKMYTTEGVGAFYSGLGAALLGLSHVAVQFPTYEYLKTKFTGKGMGASQDDEAEWVSILSASVLSKIAASGVTYPHEVIRTRLQTQRRPVPGAEFLEGLGGFTRLRGTGLSGMVLQAKYRGIVDTFHTILREEGWRALYNGMGVNMARSVPAATVTMMSYEYVMSSLLRIKDDANDGLDEVL